MAGGWPSGSFDSTINILDAISGSIKLSIALLPGNEWIAYHPQKWVYNSSLQGDEYVAIHFDNQLHPVYPLKYYRQELKRPDLEQAFLGPQPFIKPKSTRLYWDRFENKGIWFGGLLFVLLTSATASATALCHQKLRRPHILYSGGELTRPCPGYISSTST
jgi:hypothetical protein